MITDQKMFLTVLLYRLTELRDKAKFRVQKGMCNYLSHVQILYIRGIFRKWPKFSGQINFPVPSPYKSVSHGAAYFKYNRWSKKSKYGQLRHELLDFVIATVEQRLKELP